MKDSVLSAEQLVLRSLGFDVQPSIPTRRLLLVFLLSFERDFQSLHTSSQLAATDARGEEVRDWGTSEHEGAPPVPINVDNAPEPLSSTTASPATPNPVTLSGAASGTHSFQALAQTCTAILNDAGTSARAGSHTDAELAAGVLYLGVLLHGMLSSDAIAKYGVK